MNEPRTRLSRRGFLFAVAAGGAVTAAPMVAKNLQEPPSADNNDDKRATRGYHASRHVEAYYRTVKV